MKNLPKDHTGTKTRACISCGEIKPPEMFSLHKNAGAYGGYHALPKCKACMKVYKLEAHFVKSYGITIEEYNKMSVAQNHTCAICKSTGSGRDGNRLVVDHCHSTGVVRGLLCWPCNIGIGMFKDKPDILTSVIAYLNSSNDIKEN